MVETINQRIKRLREERKLTQKEVAKKLNISQSTYAAFEKNGKVTTERAIQLATIFNVSVNEILIGNLSLTEGEKKSNLLKQNVMTDFNKTENRGFILTKKEENRIKIMRQLSREDEKELDEFLNEKYQKSKKKS